MYYDRTVYFNNVRATLFSGALAQDQVDGQSVILAAWEYQTGMALVDERWLAYMLATTYHETATRMWPIEEYGKGAGHSYGEPDPETGQCYFGRGFVQLTWRENYGRASTELNLTDARDLVWQPQLALDSLIATRVLFRGMSQGWFTGKRLDDYFSDEEDDPVSARVIINNDVQTMGKTIAGYYEKFRAALEAAMLPEPGQKTEPVVVQLHLASGTEYEVIVNQIAVAEGSAE